MGGDPRRAARNLRTVQHRSEAAKPLDPKAKWKADSRLRAMTRCCLFRCLRCRQSGSAPRGKPAGATSTGRQMSQHQTTKRTRLNGLVEDPDIPGTFYHPDGTIATDAGVRCIRPTPAPSGLEKPGSAGMESARRRHLGEPLPAQQRPVTSFALQLRVLPTRCQVTPPPMLAVTQTRDPSDFNRKKHPSTRTMWMTMGCKHCRSWQH